MIQLFQNPRVARIALSIFALAAPQCVLHASADQAKNGPFGFVVGEDVSNYECEQLDTNTFSCTPLRSHPDFVGYGVKASPATGICWIKAVGSDVETNGYGTSLKTQVDKIAGQIRGTYGAPDSRESFLLPSSIWDEGDDWMMAIAQNERVYSHVWEDAGVRGITNIYVTANAQNSNSGYVTVEFYGKNYDECDAAANLQESDAF